MSEPSAKTTDEATFLGQQAEDARAALSDIARDLKANVSQSLDPHKLTRSHPWMAVGAAAVAGFAASWLATPSREQKIARELRHLQREAERSAGETASAGSNHHTSARRSGIPWATLLRPAAMAAVRGLASALAAAQAANHKPPAHDQADDPSGETGKADSPVDPPEPGTVRNI